MHEPRQSCRCQMALETWYSSEKKTVEELHDMGESINIYNADMDGLQQETESARRKHLQKARD